MRFFGSILALISVAGPLALAPPNAFSQSSAFGENLVSMPESATYRPADETVQVQAALNQFDSALDAHDVGRLRAAGIKAVSAKRWQSFFRDNPRATITDRCPISELFDFGKRSQLDLFGDDNGDLGRKAAGICVRHPLQVC